jgi:hypothetical protein
VTFKGTDWCYAMASMLVFSFSCGLSANIDITRRAVNDFHRQLSQGPPGVTADAIYDQATDRFRMGISRELNRSRFARLQRKMGSCPTSTEIRIAVNAGEKGVYVDAAYMTTCAAGPLNEMFVWKIENGEAKLDGYETSSPRLLTD